MSLMMGPGISQPVPTMKLVEVSRTCVAAITNLTSSAPLAPVWLAKG